MFGDAGHQPRLPSGDTDRALDSRVDSETCYLSIDVWLAQIGLDNLRLATLCRKSQRKHLVGSTSGEGTTTGSQSEMF